MTWEILIVMLGSKYHVKKQIFGIFNVNAQRKGITVYHLAVIY